MSEQPRVLFCCFDVVPGPHAQSRRLTEYIKGLGDRFQVVVLSVKTADNSHIQRYHGARLLRVPVGAGDLPARVQAFDRAVRRQLESEEYLLVHFFDPFGGYALCERRAELGYRVIYDASTFPSVEMPLADTEVDSNRKFIARMRRQELFCLMNADSVVAGSEIGRRYVVELGVAATKVSILHAPIDLEPFDPEVMGQPDGAPMRLVHLGSENPWAGLSTLVQALGLLPETLAHLTIVGPKHPNEHPKLSDQVSALKLEKVIEFQDPVSHDDIHKVLAASDVGLLTMADVERNRSPGGPLARLGEYLAAGRPVIAADLPLARELVPPEAALFYRPDDATSLAEAISTLAADPARRVAMGAAGRQAALKWDASSVRGALLDLYSSIAGAVAPLTDDEAVKVPSGIGQINDAVTQLGPGSFAQEGDSGNAAQPGASRGSTDPEIVGPGGDGATDPQTESARPPLMGTPLRDDPPVVVGEMLPSSADERADFALGAVTDLEVREEPVVMGLPVWLNDGGPVAGDEGDSVPWVDAPSPLPETPVAPGSAISAPPSAKLLYPFTPAKGLMAASRTDLSMSSGAPSEPEALPTPRAMPAVSSDLSVTPRAPTPAFVASPTPQALMEQTPPSSVIVDQSLLSWEEASDTEENQFASLRAAQRPAEEDDQPTQEREVSPKKGALERMPGAEADSRGGQTPRAPNDGSVDLMPLATPRALRPADETIRQAPTAPPRASRAADERAHPVELESRHSRAHDDPAGQTPRPSDETLRPTAAPRASRPNDERTSAVELDSRSPRPNDERASRPADDDLRPSDETIRQAPTAAPRASRPTDDRTSAVALDSRPSRSNDEEVGQTPPSASRASRPTDETIRPTAPPRSARPADDGPSGASTRQGPVDEPTPVSHRPPPPSQPSALRAAASRAPEPGAASRAVMADEPKAARANVSVAVKPPSKALPPVPPERPGSPPPRSSGSGVMRSSTSGVFAAPANSLAGMTLPPISAPHRPGYSSAATPPPLPPPRLASKPKPREEIVEVLSDDVMPVEDDALDEAASSDEVMEADGLGVDPTSDEVSLPPSALDPWFAQLVHGYCPPEAQLFARHVPPTTMPGRD